MTENTTASGAAGIATTICRSVAELPDRNSPSYFPEAMLVTHKELHAIIVEALAPVAPVAPTRIDADRLTDRLMSSDPEFDDCADAASLIQKQAASIELLHVAICQAVTLLNAAVNPFRVVEANDILRHALVAYADSELANPEAAPVAPTQPDWRELCRRLYVELFHCDKQMTCSLNEDGEPIWRTGPEVRDVLSDAKAALEANPITPEAAPVAPAHQPAPMPYPTDAQIDAVYEQTMSQHLRSQDAPAVRRFGRAMFLCAWNAAAPKAASLQPDWCELRRLHALAVADADADRILAEWRAYKPAPLQQGEYLPLPKRRRRFLCTKCGSEQCKDGTENKPHPPCNKCNYLGFAEDCDFNDEEMRAYVDADRAMRGAAQADTVFQCGKAAGRQEMKEAQQSSDFDTWVRRAYRVPYPATYTIYNMEVAYQAGRESAAQAAPAPVAEDADDAARWRLLPLFMQGYDVDWVELLYNLEVTFKRGVRAQAAQPEGGADANR